MDAADTGMVAALDAEARWPWSEGTVLAAGRYTPKDFWPTIPMFLRLKRFSISLNIGMMFSEVMNSSNFTKILYWH